MQDYPGPEIAPLYLTYLLIYLLTYFYAPINVNPHYSPPGLTRGFSGDLTFPKIIYSTHRGTTGGQLWLECTLGNCLILIACELNLSVKISNDQMPHYWDKYSVQIESKSPTNPLVSPGGG